VKIKWILDLSVQHDWYCLTNYVQIKFIGFHYTIRAVFG